MVIAIAGIVAAMVAVFIRQPIDAYVDSARRAMLTDIADTVTWRIFRDLQAALPNSVRVAPGGLYLEYTPILTAGRYRTGPDVSSNPGDPFELSPGDDSFDVLGPKISANAGDGLVIYNQNVSDVYTGVSRRAVVSVTDSGAVSNVKFAGGAFTEGSPGGRFQIVGQPVSYVCDLATRTLRRYTGYGFQAAQPTSFNNMPGAPLATRLSACNFDYRQGPLEHTKLVTMLFSFSAEGETVTLQQQVNVDNVP
jgi:MSHA biogenesis protein MshO